MTEQATNRFRRQLMAVPLVVVGMAILGSVGCDGRPAADIELFPKHFDLRPGESIHYMPLQRSVDGDLQFFDDYQFETGNPQILEPGDIPGLFRALAPGRTEIVVKSPRAQQRYDIEITGPVLSVLEGIPHTEVDRIEGEDVLFVGHANLDGYDHTAVAKLGIDRLIRERKSQGHQVVYWVSEEFPNWYTEDRQADLTIISEGQEHRIVVEADRVAFAGGGFMMCLLRNVQMTLHGMIREGAQDEPHFVFPVDAIWMTDVWGPGIPRPYPAPMVLLGSVWEQSTDDEERYEDIVVPFLDRLFTEYPFAGYPAVAPDPELRLLVDGWNVEVIIDGRFKRIYQQDDSSRTIVMEFRT